jgi:hypothetical protein
MSESHTTTHDDLAPAAGIFTGFVLGVGVWAVVGAFALLLFG